VLVVVMMMMKIEKIYRDVEEHVFLGQWVENMQQNTANIFSALRAASKVALAVPKAHTCCSIVVAFLFLIFLFFLFFSFVVLLFVLVWFGFGFGEELRVFDGFGKLCGGVALPTFYSMGPKIVTKSLGKAFWVEVGMSPSTCFQDCFKLCKGTLSLWIHLFFYQPFQNTKQNAQFFFLFSSLIIFLLLLLQTILTTISLFNNYVYLNISVSSKNQISSLFPFLCFSSTSHSINNCFLSKRQDLCRFN